MGIVYKKKIIGSHTIFIPLNVYTTVTKIRGEGDKIASHVFVSI